MHQQHDSHEQDHGGPCHADTVAAVTDPVCGMTVAPATTPHHADHAGTAYHFCSAGCRTKFERDAAGVAWRVLCQR